jgi:uncharacterized membrane protein
MESSRLEAFSDGVIAIIITIMVLEFDLPEEPTIAGLVSVIPVILGYLVSFLYIGSYWNSHQHLFQGTKTINGKVLWANLNFLFWLSLLPFFTKWLEGGTEAVPLAAYGVILLMCAISSSFLRLCVMQANNHEKQVYKRIKVAISIVAYLSGIVFSFYVPVIAILCYVSGPLIWLKPSDDMPLNSQAND